MLKKIIGICLVVIGLSEFFVALITGEWRLLIISVIAVAIVVAP